MHAIAAEQKHFGTASKIIVPNKEFLSSSEEHVPRIMLPLLEKGDIALACAPITITVNKTIGLQPVAAEIAGIVGNNAGVTTPIVLLKNDIKHPNKHKNNGTQITGILLLTQEASISTVPAFTAT